VGSRPAPASKPPRALRQKRASLWRRRNVHGGREFLGAVEAVILGAHPGNRGDGLVTVTDLGEVYSIRAG
jgi:hypothetical protein